MKTNVGSFDCAVRFVVGCGLLLLGNHSLGWWGFAGLVPILNAILEYCPVYALLGISTLDPDAPKKPARVTRRRVRVDARRPAR